MKKNRPTVIVPTACPIRLTALLGALLLLGGCSTFDHDFKEAAGVTPPDAMSGAWTGTWQSDFNGHTGKLRAIVTRQNDSDYEARYHATYAGFLTFEYTTTLQAETDPDTHTTFEGAEDLGYAKEGTYHYRGHTDGETFFSTYKANVDHGTYTMTRP